MDQTRQFRRGIYLLPTLFTIGNLFCGYSSLVRSVEGALEQAAIFIIIAGVLDGLDGRIARLTGTSSDFGVQFDTLADVVSFGIAPALLAHQWALEPLDRMGRFIAFIYVVCAAMRLARFNLKVNVEEKRHFAGLPSPAAGAVIACVVFAFPELVSDKWAMVAIACLVTSVALLMISRFRYRSFKEFDLRNRRSYVYVLPLATMVVAIAVYPKWALPLFSVAYASSAPAGYVLGLVRRVLFPQPAGAGQSDGNTEVADEPLAR
jgi:CDP-diacylglycerol--serine O-phosphatidyltransferase